MQLSPEDWLGTEDAKEFYSLFPLTPDTIGKFKALLVRQMQAGRPLVLSKMIADKVTDDGGFTEGVHFVLDTAPPGTVVDRQA